MRNFQMNFVFISPHFPRTYWNFCDRLKKNGVRVLGIGDAPFGELDDNLKNSLTEYYLVPKLEDYNAVFKAVAFFSFKYGKIDWLESNNEYWLEQDAKLRTDFNITTGVQSEQIEFMKEKHLMKVKYLQNDIPTAKQHQVTTIEEARAFLDVTGYPVIAKPDVGVGATHTYKLHSDFELEKFFAEKPDAPYVIEEFIDGDICSYDAIIDSHMNPLFESMTVWPPSIMDIVNKQLDLSYYTSAYVPPALQTLGRKTVAAFGAKSRFVHLEFFRLKTPRRTLGDVGDFVALEVNMRPAGGYTPDMMNFAHSTDVYQIWADMVSADKIIHPLKDSHQFCAYASRRECYEYVHSHEEIMERYGSAIVMQEEMPPMNWPQMGRWMYTAKTNSEEETLAFIHFVHEKRT